MTHSLIESAFERSAADGSELNWVELRSKTDRGIWFAHGGTAARLNDGTAQLLRSTDLPLIMCEQPYGFSGFL